jgi:hypothetical protein
MSYPHMRVSAGARAGTSGEHFHQRSATRIYADRAEYAGSAESMGWDRFIATGWARTQGLEPVRVHESGDMVVLAGGWTRQRDDGSPIVSNRVLYTLTRLEGGWGIQARFGIDSRMPEGDRPSHAVEHLKCANRLLADIHAGDYGQAPAYLDYPLAMVLGPGLVKVLLGPEDWRSLPNATLWMADSTRSIEVFAAGATGALAVFRAGGAAGGSIGALIADRGGQWRLVAITGRLRCESASA